MPSLAFSVDVDYILREKISVLTVNISASPPKVFNKDLQHLLIKDIPVYFFHNVCKRFSDDGFDICSMDYTILLPPLI